MDFLFLLGSTRRDGNTEALARQAATHLPAEANQSWLRLSDLPLPTFGDVRHEGRALIHSRWTTSASCWRRPSGRAIW